MTIAMSSRDQHAQLRALYMTLLSGHGYFDEFKQLLALYTAADDDVESEEAAAVRARLNERVREWLGGNFDGLSVRQVVQWRAIIVEERINVALAPWKEANIY